MLKQLNLTNFKNFQDATLTCGPLTILMGTNAAGKSNVRDALRFLHGIGRGYKLAEIFGEKYTGGALQWQGIRGGVTESAYCGAPTFRLEVVLELPVFLTESTASQEEINALRTLSFTYRIEIEPLSTPHPKIIDESLDQGPEKIFWKHTDDLGPRKIKMHLRESSRVGTFATDQPVLSQIVQQASLGLDGNAAIVRGAVHEILQALESIRFLDLNPEAMRIPSVPGQPLGDRGENLSSALLTICEDAGRKRALLAWIQALTPMDAQDFEFVPDQTGRVLVNLIEAGNRRTSAYSASDGTLRFLAIAAALLSEEPHLYCLEELENGIHPTRLYLLLDFIERNAAKRHHQVIATTHSPQLLQMISPETLAHTSLVYRQEGQPAGEILSLGALPEPAREVLHTQSLARLHESGWFEDVAALLEAE